MGEGARPDIEGNSLAQDMSTWELAIVGRTFSWV